MIGTLAGICPKLPNKENIHEKLFIFAFLHLLIKLFWSEKIPDLHKKLKVIFFLTLNDGLSFMKMSYYNYKIKLLYAMSS